LIGIGRRQDHLRRYAVFGVGAISARLRFITGLCRHSGNIVDDALFEVSSHVAAL